MMIGNLDFTAIFFGSQTANRNYFLLLIICNLFSDVKVPHKIISKPEGNFD